MDDIFVLGFWCNPYRPEKEYYWFHAETMKEARAIGDNKQKNGQPKNFTNWVKGKNSYFTDIDKFEKACHKVDFRPNLNDYR